MTPCRIVINIGCLLAFIGLCWIDLNLTLSIMAMSTFSAAKALFGVVLIVFVAIVLLGLHLYGTVLELLFQSRLQTAKELIADGKPEVALHCLIQAQIFNDRWSQRKDFRLTTLQELLSTYHKIGDSSSAADVAYRIRAIEEANPGPSIEQLVAEEALTKQPKEPKNRLFYVSAVVFVSSIFAWMYYLHGAPDVVPSWQDFGVRLIGWAGSVFILAEAMHGRAHGGSGPTAHFHKQPIWFTIRSGLLLFAGLSMMLRLDQLVSFTGYWQLPATGGGWAIGIGGILVCCLLTFALANLFSKFADIPAIQQNDREPGGL